MATLVARRARRGRARGRLVAAFAVATVAAIVAITATVFYQLAASRYAMEAERLRRDLAVVKEAGRRAVEQSASAEQRAAMALARSAQAQRDRDAAVPQGDAARLLRLVERRLADGVGADRLAFVIGAARPSPVCDDKLEIKRLQPRTPLNTSTVEAAVFLGDKVTVTAQAASLSGADGSPQPGYDPSQPVELRFTRIGGAVDTARGLLPLGHAFVLAGRELRFLGRVSEKARNAIEISLQSCEYP